MTFKERFKYYRRKVPPPDLDTVINVRKEDSNLLKQIKHLCEDSSKLKSFGLICPSRWKIYELNSHPGLIYITNPFTSTGQRYWIGRSLKDYTRKPSITNLDSQVTLDTGTWWSVASAEPDHKANMRKKLRWATMGYHHNWDSKVYSEEVKSGFPCDLAKLCEYVIGIVLQTNFKAEACIVNFYPMDSYLSGHVDKSEANMSAPLISFSFGQTAIFLIGGHTLEESPIALLVESGDIIIMMGESRLRYHGVPKIIRTSIEPWNDLHANGDHILSSNNNPINLVNTDEKEEHIYNEEDRITLENVENASANFWKPFSKYISDARVNINVRVPSPPTPYNALTRVKSTHSDQSW